ncbi:MAG TPA: MBL fold metallo-hydrolase [Chitinophagaceae bacterium]|nr:MBL fold metallo-hydrolase [Chitinophagaceae bacterium]
MRPFLFLIIQLIPILALTQENFDSVSIKTSKITNSVYMLEGAGGNIGVLVGNDGVIIVDDQFGPLTEKIKKAISAISDKPVKFVINTHYHLDHAGGNPNFGGEGAIIVSHENTRKRLSTDQFIAAFKMEQKALTYEGLPKITFTESITFNLNGETVQVIHVKNAHTDGDAIIYFKEANVLHSGDVFVRYGLPFIDQQNGGSIDGMISASDKILVTSNEKTAIIPGHGQLSGKKDVLDFKKMLQTVRGRVADGIKKGKTLDAIISSDPGRGYTSVFDKAAFVNTIYYSLKK